MLLIPHPCQPLSWLSRREQRYVLAEAAETVMVVAGSMLEREVGTFSYPHIFVLFLSFGLLLPFLSYTRRILWPLRPFPQARTAACNMEQLSAVRHTDYGARSSCSACCAIILPIGKSILTSVTISVVPGHGMKEG